MDFQLGEYILSYEEYFIDTFFNNGTWIKGNIVNNSQIKSDFKKQDLNFFIDSFGDIEFYIPIVNNEIQKNLIIHKLRDVYQGQFYSFFEKFQFDEEIHIYNITNMSFLYFDFSSNYIDVLFSYFIFEYLNSRSLVVFLKEENYNQIQEYFIAYFIHNRDSLRRQFNLRNPIMSNIVTKDYGSFYEELIAQIED